MPAGSWGWPPITYSWGNAVAEIKDLERREKEAHAILSAIALGFYLGLETYTTILKGAFDPLSFAAGVATMLGGTGLASLATMLVKGRNGGA